MQKREPSSSPPADDREVQRVRTAPPSFELVADDIDEEEHEKMDKTVQVFAELAASSSTTFVLSTVVKLSPQMDQRYSDIVTTHGLLETELGLVDEVRKAWALGTFRRLRLMKILRSNTDDSLVGRPTTLWSDELGATAKAWTTEFAGKSHILLEHAIHGMNRDRFRIPDECPAYANVVPIVQSSGMGKSRTVDEFAKLVFTLPFNLRPEDEESGYPLPDGSIRNFFAVRKHPPEDNEALGTRYMLFLGRLFTRVCEEISAEPTCANPLEVASRWRERLLKGDFRNELYANAIKIEPLQFPNNEDVQSFAKKAALSLITMIRSKSSAPTPPERQHDVTLVLYFDESHNLTTDKTSMKVATKVVYGPWTAYQTLCKCLDGFAEEDLFNIFLSTSSNLLTYSPSQQYAWSARARNAPVDTFQAPFVELPFDQWSEPTLVHENKHSLKEVARSEFMVRFGRPLFWTRWNAGNRLVQEDIINFAMLKLTAQPPTDTTADGLMAAIALRLLLEFEPTRQRAIIAENKLVQGHMRVAFSVPAHREYMRSGAPSEPILAEAAARVMANSMSSKAMLSANILAYVKSGLISKGEHGELVARLLLTLAHDAACRPPASSSQVSRLTPIATQYSQPVAVLDFFKELLGKDHMEKVLHSEPQNIRNGTTFEAAFKAATIRFTHFAKAGDTSVVSDHSAFVAMCRGAAWQCFNQQKDIDIIVPVLLRDELIGRFVMSAILIQIKNRTTKQAIYVDAEKLNFFSPGGDDRAQTRPYIVLTMDLGAQPTPPPVPKPKAKSESTGAQAATPPFTPAKLVTAQKVNVHEAGKPGAPRGAKPLPSRHPRYFISVTGCSSGVYNVITPPEKNIYAQLLTSRSLMNEHPRQEKMFREAVQQLKPTWEYGSSYDWVSYADAPPNQAWVLPDDHQEGVVVGKLSDEQDDSGDE